MEEVVSEAFGWQNLRQGYFHGKTVHRNILDSVEAVERREGGRLASILQYYFSASRTHFGSRSKDEQSTSLSVFLMLSS